MRLTFAAISRAGLAAVTAALLLPAMAAAQQTAPKFQPEPFWPKPLPENWILGQVAGIAVDPQDNIWIIHRPASLLDDEKGAQKNPPETKCCNAAPPVLKFDPDGNLLASWGGADSRPPVGQERARHPRRPRRQRLARRQQRRRPDPEIHAGRKIPAADRQGRRHQGLGVADAARPAGAHDDRSDDANEIYVADGYGNHRVIVFDSKTGAFKRMWGAYGKPPSDEKMPAYKPDAKPSEQFSNPVHCVRLSNDGLVYVCDRANDRIQVFRKDGTFVKEFRVTPETLANGSVWDLVLSEDAGAEVHLHGRRRQRPDRHARPRDRRRPDAMGPPRPPARPVQVGPQHRHRFQGQSLHRRGRIRPPRAEIQEDAMIRTSVAVAAISLMLVSGRQRLERHLEQRLGPEGQRHRRHHPVVAGERGKFLRRSPRRTARAGTSSRWRPASTACPATSLPTSACGIRRVRRRCGTRRRVDVTIDK